MGPAMSPDRAATNRLLLVWRNPQTDPAEFAEQLLGFAAPHSGSSSGVAQCNIADHHVAAAAPLRQQALDPAPEALVRIAVPNTDTPRSVSADEIAGAFAAAPFVGAVHCYEVTTREPLADRHPPSNPGERTTGWSQIALLRRAAEMDTDGSRARWLDRHTRLAIETQSTFRYVQHVVETSLSRGAPLLDGIVEECFPTGAMTDPDVFFASGGDRARRNERIDAMVASVESFLDLARLDVIPTSEYRFDHRSAS